MLGPWNPNRGIGFNRGTWQTGNAIGRATMPYVKSAGKKVSEWLKRAKTKRADKKSAKRTARNLFPMKRGIQVPASAGETRSYFTLVKPNVGISATKLLGKSSINRSQGFSASSTQGLQNASNIGAAFSGADIVNIYTSINQTTAAANAAKVLLVNYHSDIQIVNAETTHVHFELYDVIARMDAGTINVDPSTVFLAGCVDSSGGAAANALVPGTTPWNCPRFIAAYKILQKTDVALAPGQLHIHKVRYAPNMVYNHERDIIPAAVGVNPIAGLTVYTMLIQRGTPVHDDTTETSVTIGVSKLDIVQTESLVFQNMLSNFPSNSITTTLVTNLTGFQMATDAPTDIADAS